MVLYKREAPPAEELVPRVCFLSRLIRCKFNEAIAEEGLFSGQQDALLALVENEGITPSELAAKTGVSPATVSVSVKRMEKAGFIVKKPDDKNARIIHLYPTEKAKKALKKVKKKMNGLETTLRNGMTEDEALELSRFLQLGIDNLINEGDDFK